MKTFTKPQGIFIGVVTLVFASMIANGLVYYLNGVNLTALFSHWQYNMIGKIIFDSAVRPEIKLTAYWSLFWGTVIALIFPVSLLIKINLTKKNLLHGDAQFASDRDIKNSPSITWGVENGKGVIVGKHKGKLLRYIAPDFISLGAGTRAGKGAAVVITNLMAWTGSAVVLDLKQECYNITSRYRQKVLGNKVYLFNPFSGKTQGFNPLYYVDLSTVEGSTDLMGVAEIIYPTDTVTGTEKHFNHAGQSLFIAYVKTLWFLINEAPHKLITYKIKKIFSIGTAMDLYYQVARQELIDFLGSRIEDIENAVVKNTAQDAHDKLSSFENLGDEAQGSVVGTFEKQLKLFSLPQFRQATDRNDFDFKQLRREKITLYLGILPKEIKIAPIILNLFFNTALKINLSENPDFDPSLKHSALFLMDEFPSIGAMGYVKDSAGYIAGYKLQLLTIFQNQSQLNEIYGYEGTKTLLANHSCKVNYAISEQADAERVSNELGFRTERSRSESKNRSKGILSKGESASEAKRPLMLPQELKTLGFDEEIIILKGEHPIKCKKAFYFNDGDFMEKLIVLSPTLKKAAEKLKKGHFPSKADLAQALFHHELEADNVNKVMTG